MQHFINRFREYWTNTLHTCQFLLRCTEQLLQSAKMIEQITAALFTEPRYDF